MFGSTARVPKGGVKLVETTRTPQGPFNRVLMALNGGYLGYIRG